MKIDPTRDMLGVVDVQPTFMPGGELPVPGGDDIVPIINQLMIGSFPNAFATQDWHPAGHSSFASSHPGKLPGDVLQFSYGPQLLWPDHAIQGTASAELHPALNSAHFSSIIRKGMHPAIDSYSAFRENDHKTSTGLADWLRGLGFRRVFLCGLAADFCVAWSAEDAISAGFETFIIEDATRAIAIPRDDGTNSATLARDWLISLGAHFISSDMIEGRRS